VEINIQNIGGGIIVKLSGRLDTNTSPSLQKAFDEMSEGAYKSNVVLDFSGLDYISSAGLRALLMLQKNILAAQGSLNIKNPNLAVREVFNMTGLSAVFNI
jgi:anti-anti-sigma factor